MGAEETHAEETNSPSPTPNVTNTPDTGIEDNEFGAAYLIVIGAGALVLIVFIIVRKRS
ncbi:MAG TPA: hypothetical protein GXZ66_01405 [Clostridiaceae bacterium]|nr:hypothetical protein [Clostridiaceae bacterium]